MPPCFIPWEEQKHNSQCIITYNIKEVGVRVWEENHHYLVNAYIAKWAHEFQCQRNLPPFADNIVRDDAPEF